MHVRMLVGDKGGALTSSSIRCEDGQPLLARVVLNSDDDDEMRTLRIESLDNPLVLFSSGHVHFETSRLPYVRRRLAQTQTNQNEQNHNRESSSKARKRLALFDNLKAGIAKVWIESRQALSSVVDDLIDAGRILFDSIVVVGEYVLTGKIEGEIYGALYQVEWNYNAETKSALRAEFLPPESSVVGCSDNAKKTALFVATATSKLIWAYC